MMIMIGENGTAELYDDTYDITIHCTSEEEQRKCEEILKGNRWIPADDPPEGEGYVLLSFANFSVPLVGRYSESEEGGAYYVGDDMESCISQDMIVNAWQPLPKPYRPED